MLINHIPISQNSEIGWIRILNPTDSKSESNRVLKYFPKKRGHFLEKKSPCGNVQHATQAFIYKRGHFLEKKSPCGNVRHTTQAFLYKKGHFLEKRKGNLGAPEALTPHAGVWATLVPQIQVRISNNADSNSE